MSRGVGRTKAVAGAVATQTAFLQGTNTEAGDTLGRSVAIDGDTGEDRCAGKGSDKTRGCEGL